VEGGLDVYVPALNSQLGLAEVPGPGNYMLNYAYFLEGSFDVKHKAALDGGGQRGPRYGEEAFAYVPVYIHVSEHELLGGNILAGIAQPLGNASLIVSGQESTAYGAFDAYAIPFGLTWKSQHFDAILYEGLNVPWGEYNTVDPMVLGLNYWVFDTNLLTEWRIPNTKLEFNSDIGYSINTKNQATDYLSGHAIHWDYTLGYKLTKRLRAGFQGYLYYQVTGDSGTGAVLGSFKGEAVGVGATLQYNGGTENLAYQLNFTWQKDVHAKNRLRYDAFAVQLVLSLDQLREKIFNRGACGNCCHCNW
jgi:hypothetical protein